LDMLSFFIRNERVRWSYHHGYHRQKNIQPHWFIHDQVDVEPLPRKHDRVAFNRDVCHWIDKVHAQFYANARCGRTHVGQAHAAALVQHNAELRQMRGKGPGDPTLVPPSPPQHAASAHASYPSLFTLSSSHQHIVHPRGGTQRETRLGTLRWRKRWRTQHYLTSYKGRTVSRLTRYCQSCCARCTMTNSWKSSMQRWGFTN
jgi:hypothetical protein